MRTRRDRAYPSPPRYLTRGPAGSDEGLVLAYQAACDILKMQDATLANVRSRATQVLSTAALLTSIAAGLGLVNLDPKRGAPLSTTGAWSILVVTMAIGALVVYVQWPVRGWIFGPSAAKILAERKDNANPAHLRLFVLTALNDGITTNDGHLKRRQAAFRWAAAGLIVEVGALVVMPMEVVPPCGGESA
jgi:hypothetical protein